MYVEMFNAIWLYRFPTTPLSLSSLPSYVWDPFHSSSLSQDTRLIPSFPVPQRNNCIFLHPNSFSNRSLLYCIPVYPEPTLIPYTSFFHISDFLSNPFPSIASSFNPRHQFLPLLHTINLYPDTILFFPATPSPAIRTWSWGSWRWR